MGFANTFADQKLDGMLCFHPCPRQSPDNRHKEDAVLIHGFVQSILLLWTLITLWTFTLERVIPRKVRLWALFAFSEQFAETDSCDGLIRQINNDVPLWPCRALVRTDTAGMLKRRLKQAGLPAHYSPHSFRATGIANFLENDGTLEAAQRIARPR
jgi:hypothetical protein